MSRESDFIGLLRSFATDPAARGLADDCAVLEIGAETLILTHDMMAEGVHFLPDADPADVAWKLVAANLSDLAAKGAEPVGVLLGFTLGESEWDKAFAGGLREVLAKYDVPLLGGDTVGGHAGRVFGLTAMGRATHRPVPSRAAARAGDALYVTGTLGDAFAGFEAIQSGGGVSARLIAAYNRPVPLLDQGRALAPIVHAMMDVSDGLLLDASRMAKTSGLALEIDLSGIPLSAAYIDARGNDQAARMAAASWGDDYQLLFAAPAEMELPVKASKVGKFSTGNALTLCDGDEAVSLPTKLGFEHG